MVMGIDPSSTSTGIVLLDDSGNLVNYYLVTPDKSLNFEDRCLKTIKKVLEIADKYAKELTTIRMEAPAFMAKGKVISLAQLNGGIYYGLRALNTKIPVQLITPSSLKKASTGNGRASKEDMIGALPDEVRDAFYDHTKKIDDLADAFHLANTNFGV